MSNPIFFNKGFVQYLLKFIIAFCILYFGTLGVIGLCAPGGYYSSFVHNYLDYVSLLRSSLLHGSKLFLSLLGYKSDISSIYIIRLDGGKGIRMVYSCIGYGIMSFWGAFVFANKGTWIKKLKWIVAGWLIIWCINVTRISLLILAINKNWAVPFNLDHHTLFNIAAYTAIFILIYFFDRSGRDSSITNQSRGIAKG
jgi:exosortase/archaeosortase family protein